MMITKREATIDDVALLTALIKELAVYDKLGDEASVIEDDILRDGFGTVPRFRAAIAREGDAVAGYVLFFPFYSSFQGRAGLFLDDIYVREAFRGKGVGDALLGHVAKTALHEEYFCVRCEMLDWNQLGIDFYAHAGAVFLEEWKAALLIGESLVSAADKAPK